MKNLLTKTQDPAIFNLQLDNTSQDAAIHCPRSAEHTLITSRIPSGRRSPLEFGSAVHLALEYRYKNYPTDKALSAGPTMAAITQAINYLTETSPPEADDWRNADQASDVLLAYFKKYPTEPWRVTHVELPFILPLGTLSIDKPLPYEFPDIPKGTYVKSLNVYWTGKIDIVGTTFTGKPFIMDHKTSSMLGPSYWKGFELSQQMFGYCWAASQLFEKPITTCLVNVLGSRKPTRTGKKIELDRTFYHYTPEQLYNWQDNTLELVRTFTTYLFNAYFPQHHPNCVGKYGTCPFHDVCSLPLDQQPTMLASNFFTNNNWTPLT